MRQTRIGGTLGHGLSWQGLGKLKISNLVVVQAGLTGLAFFTSPGECVESPLLCGHSGGGIVVVGASVCIKGGFLVANKNFGIRVYNASVTVEGTNIWDTASAPDGSWGDGIDAMMSLVVLDGVYVKNSARTGVANSGSVLAPGASRLDCNAIDLEGETLHAGFFGPGIPPADLDFVFQDLGGNTCGCGGATDYPCQWKSKNLEPPESLTQP